MEELIEQLTSIMSSLEDFEYELQKDADIIKVKKEDNTLTVIVEKEDIGDKFRKYVESLDDDIYEKATEDYKTLTGKTLKSLDDKLNNNELTEKDIKEFEDVVKAEVIWKVRDYISKFNIGHML